jgi:uncharacterized membrane protein YfcA
MDASLIATYALLAIAAFCAGAMNSVAGGGTFLSFPALLAAGVPPVMANASNSVALWPGSLAAAWAFRTELLRFRKSLPLLTLVAFLGGIAGGLLLLATSNAAFANLIPWLLLVATVLFAFSTQFSALVAACANPRAQPMTAPPTAGKSASAASCFSSWCRYTVASLAPAWVF